ncbi:MAG TPA: patatin-like phospholipase family protein, partial [Marmoricola sp.]|nr:patatin-like phospholipase family protein [Marmoricola sp.]
MSTRETAGTAGDQERPEKVAVVLSGAAARGAFQAGALAALVPALEREGLRPTVWLGTSAGSINSAVWGSLAHLDVTSAAERTVELWQEMGHDDVYRPLPVSLPRTGLEYAAGALLGVGPGTISLLDTSPLRRTAHERLDADSLHRNITEGRLDAVGVVATRMPSEADAVVVGAASGRSVIFLDEHRRSGYAGDPDRALDVHRGPIVADHVLASSAIPVAFPAVRVDRPAPATGWYVDGGVRLNTPLHPAVGLGATKVVVVSATSTTYAASPPPALDVERPDVADAAAQVMHAVLADRTTEDLRALRRTNRLVAQAGAAGRVLTRSSGEPYRAVEVMTVSPPVGEMARLAAETYARRTQGLGRLTELDNWLLGRALRGAGDGVGRRELLSYLLFDEEYFAAGIELGRRTAEATLAMGW